MNEFAYNLRLAKIDAAKYVKDIRKLVYLYTPDNYNWRGNSLTDFQKYVYEYKIYSKVLNKFAQNSTTLLPDKFYNLLKSTQTNLLRDIVDKPDRITYEQFVDIFEYTSLLTITNINSEEFQTLCNIVKNKPLPFDIEFNIYTHIFSTSNYFIGFSNREEVAVLTWAKINKIPESYTILKKYRQQNKYINIQENYNKLTQIKKNLQLAIKSINQLTGEPVVEQ